MTTENHSTSPDTSALPLDTELPEQDIHDGINDLEIPFPSSRHNVRPAKREPTQSKRLKWRAKGKLHLAGNHCYLTNLPDDILRVLLARIPPRGLKALSETCRELRQILGQDSIWRESYLYRFFDSVRGTGDAKVLVQACLGDPRGWRREGLARETMLERWTDSKAQPVPHHPPVGLIHSLSLSYPTPILPRPTQLVVGKTHSTPTKPDTTNVPSTVGTPSDGMGNTPTPTKMTHRERYDALIAATTRPPPNVLSAGLGVGGVVRSDPLSGKVSKGFWGPGRDANFHLRPHVDHHSPPTAIHLRPHDQSVVLWGLLTGMVVHTTILTKHSSTPGSRANSINITCEPSNAHEGEVLDIYAPDTSSPDGLFRFVTAGADGRVKYWQVNPAQRSSGKRSPATDTSGSMTCVFTSNPNVAPFDSRSDVVKLRQAAHPDALVLARCEKGVVCGVTEDGDLRIWWETDGHREEARVDVGSSDQSGGVKRLELEVTMLDNGLLISVLIHHRRAASFSRWDIATDAEGGHDITERKYTSSLGLPLIALHASLRPAPPVSISPKPLPALSSEIDSEEGESASAGGSGKATAKFGRFVAAGDSEGHVWIWPWDTDLFEVTPTRGWKAVDNKVTSIDYHCGLIAVGSCDAYIKVYDPLPTPPTLLRSFRATHLSPADAALAQSDDFDAQFYSVNQIILENDLLVAAIGRKVFAWKAGGGKKRGAEKKGKGSSGKTPKGTSKTIDMRAVHEEALEGDDSPIDTPSRSHRRQVEKLEEMGLEDPDEALQYALMLSMEGSTEQSSSAITPAESSDAPHYRSDEDEAIRAVEEYRQREEEEMTEIMEMIRIAEERDRSR